MNKDKADQIASIILSEYCTTPQDVALIREFLKSHEKGGEPSTAAKEVADRVLTLQSLTRYLSDEVLVWHRGIIEYIVDTSIPASRRQTVDPEGTILVSKEKLAEVKIKLAKRRESFARTTTAVLSKRNSRLEARVEDLKARLRRATGCLSSLNRNVETRSGKRRMRKADWAKWLREKAAEDAGIQNGKTGRGTPGGTKDSSRTGAKHPRGAQEGSTGKDKGT